MNLSGNSECYLKTSYTVYLVTLVTAPTTQRTSFQLLTYTCSYHRMAFVCASGLNKIKKQPICGISQRTTESSLPQGYLGVASCISAQSRIPNCPRGFYAFLSFNLKWKVPLIKAKTNCVIGERGMAGFRLEGFYRGWNISVRRALNRLGPRAETKKQA